MFDWRRLWILYLCFLAGGAVVVAVAWIVMGRPWPTSFAGPTAIAAFVLFAISYLIRGTGLSVGADLFGVQTKDRVSNLSKDFAGSRGAWWSSRIPSLSSAGAALTLVAASAVLYAVVPPR